MLIQSHLNLRYCFCYCITENNLTRIEEQNLLREHLKSSKMFWGKNTIKGTDFQI